MEALLRPIKEGKPQAAVMRMEIHAQKAAMFSMARDCILWNGRNVREDGSLVRDRIRVSQGTLGWEGGVCQEAAPFARMAQKDGGRLVACGLDGA